MSIKPLDKLSIYQLLIIFLTSLYISGIFDLGLIPILKQALPAVIATTFLGTILDYLEHKTWKLSQTALITGLIIGLTAQFGAAPLALILISIAAIASKFIKLFGKHIFNPAGFGLLVGMLLLSSYPAWWGGSADSWLFLIWIPVFLYKFRRWAPVVGFLVPLALLGGPSILFSGSQLFFSWVMLIEPKTSPYQIKNGLIYGLIVALGYLILTNTSTIDPLVPSLLIGNLTARVLSRYI